MSIPFRQTAGLGKRIEYWGVGFMQKEGLDVYVPLVDDHAVDAVVKRPNGSFIEVQVKARSKYVEFGHGGLFAAVSHELRPDYWFVLYAERHDALFIFSSEEFIAEATQNKAGVNAGKRSLLLNGVRKNKETGEREEYIKDRFQRYICRDFSRLLAPRRLQRTKRA